MFFTVPRSWVTLRDYYLDISSSIPSRSDIASLAESAIQRTASRISEGISTCAEITEAAKIPELISEGILDLVKESAVEPLRTAYNAMPSLGSPPIIGNFFSYCKDLTTETARQVNNLFTAPEAIQPTRVDPSLFWSHVRGSTINMFLWSTTRPDLIACHLASTLFMPVCYTLLAGKLAKEAVVCIEIKRGANKEQAERAAYQLFLQTAAHTIVVYKKYREPAQQTIEGGPPAVKQAASRLDWMQELGKDFVEGAVIRFHDPELQPMKQGMMAGACTLAALNLVLGDTSSQVAATIITASVALSAVNWSRIEAPAEHS